MAKNKGRNQMQVTKTEETPVVEQQEVVETTEVEVVEQEEVQEEVNVVPEAPAKPKPTFRTATGDAPVEESRHSGKLNLFKILLREFEAGTAQNIQVTEAIANTRKLHNAVDILLTKLVGSELVTGINFISEMIKNDIYKSFAPTRIHRFTTVVCKSSADIEAFTLVMRLLTAYAKNPESYQDVVDADYVLSKVKGITPRRAEQVKACLK